MAEITYQRLKELERDIKDFRSTIDSQGVCECCGSEITEDFEAKQADTELRRIEDHLHEAACRVDDYLATLPES